MPDVVVALLTVAGMLAVGCWVAGRDRRRHDAEVDRRIAQRYGRG